MATANLGGELGLGVRVNTRTPRPGRMLVRLAFLGPFFLLFVIFYILPIGYAIYQSLFTIQRTGGVFGESSLQLAGVTQYTRVLTDPEFLGGLLRVAVFGLFTVPVMIAVAVAIALLLSITARRIAAVVRSLVFLPYAVPGIIAGVMWASLYQPSTSPFHQLGLNIPFLDAQWILPSIANIGIWAWAGFNVLVMVSALTALSDDVIEAARLDGASELRIALLIKVPLIRPTIVMATLFTLIGTLQLFSEPLVLRSVSSAISSGFTPNMLALSTAAGNSYNQAAAISVTLAAVTFMLSFALMGVVRRVSRP